MTTLRTSPTTSLDPAAAARGEPRPPHRRRQRNAALHQEAQRRFLSGEDPADIAAALQVQRATVLTWLRRQGLTTRSHPQRATAVALMRGGLRRRELSALMGIHPETLSRWAKEEGLPPRCPPGATLGPRKQRILGLLLSGEPPREVAALLHMPIAEIRALGQAFLHEGALAPPRATAKAARVEAAAPAPPDGGSPSLRAGIAGPPDAAGPRPPGAPSGRGPVVRIAGVAPPPRRGAPRKEDVAAAALPPRNLRPSERLFMALTQGRRQGAPRPAAPRGRGA